MKTISTLIAAAVLAVVTAGTPAQAMPGARGENADALPVIEIGNRHRGHKGYGHRGHRKGYVNRGYRRGYGRGYKRGYSRGRKGYGYKRYGYKGYGYKYPYRRGGAAIVINPGIYVPPVFGGVIIFK